MMKETIYNLIPNDRYITRNELVDLTGLKDRGCTDIKVTNDIEKVVAERISRYNSGQINVRWYYERH